MTAKITSPISTISHISGIKAASNPMVAAVRACVTVVQAVIAIETNIINPNAKNKPAIKRPTTIVITNKAWANLGFSATHTAIFSTILEIHFTKGKNAFSNSIYNSYFKIANWSAVFCVCPANVSICLAIAPCTPGILPNSTI